MPERGGTQTRDPTVVPKVEGSACDLVLGRHMVKFKVVSRLAVVFIYCCKLEYTEPL